MTEPTYDPALDEATSPCPVCADVGWQLVTDPRRLPLVVDLAPCPAGCDACAQPIEVLAVHGLFARAVTGGADRAVMSLTGARPMSSTSMPPALASRAPVPPAPSRVPSPSPFPPGARPTRPGGDPA